MSGTYGLRLLREPGVQLATLAILAVVVIAFRGLQFVALTSQVQWGYDFSYYWTAASHLLHGEPIYSAAQLAGPYAPQGQEGFLYPPPLAAAVIPLAALFADPLQAAWVWTAMGAAILVASILALWRSERLGERYPLLAGRGRWLLVAAGFAFPPVVGELVLGNVHLLLLGLTTVAWLGIRRGGARGDWIAGFAVGAAAIVKVFPAVMVLWFLATGRPRAALASLVGAALIAAITLPITGIEPWLQYPTVLANLSAPSDTTDTLAPTVWLAEITGFSVARVVVTLGGLATMLWAARALRDARVPRDGGPRGSEQEPEARAVATSFSIAVTISVLIAPAVYHHYLALLVLPLLLALGAGVPLRWLALAYFLMWGGTQAALGDLAWIVNRAMPALGAVVLLFALIRALRSAARAR